MRRARFDGLVLVLAATIVACESDSSGPEEPQVVAPQITAQPQSVTVDVGGAVTLSVTATGTAPLSYLWHRNGTAITGATASNYQFNAAAADNGVNYTVVVSNAGGSVTSQPAQVTVRTAPVITTQPQAYSGLSGIPAVFSVVAAGADTYQWRRNGVAIPGATSSSYAVGVPLAGDNGAVYSVVVSNSVGSVTSANATLSVNSGAGLRPTSYANAKGMNAGAVAVPAGSFGLARAFGNFFAAGNRDYFVATQVYDINQPMSQAQPGAFEFWRWTGTAYERATNVLTAEAGCIHPRKALVADFNKDQRPDVFVICHGYDRDPFPGEQNYVLLSQTNGMYQPRAVGSAGFYHGGTAMDVNNDGNVDVVAANNFAAQAVSVFLNDGQGNFTHRTDLLPIGAGNYFTVEAADVNGDGRTDILVGGHDWENAPTAVLINNGSGTFANVTPQTIPAVPNEGVVLDFAVLDADRDGVNEIYVLRTSGGDGTFYQSVTVQKVTWPARTSTVLLSERGRQWVAFMNPVFSGGEYSLVGDITDPPLDLDL